MQLTLIIETASLLACNHSVNCSLLSNDALYKYKLPYLINR